MMREQIAERAQLLAKTRAFFANRKVLEVETPLLSQSTVTSLHIQSLETNIHLDTIKRYFLQTSPEFAMKRLLASGSGDVYQICKAFRDAERGSRHNPEFTLLEWYRLDYNHFDLMNEVDEFLKFTVGTHPGKQLTYQQLFLEKLGFDPLDVNNNFLLQQIKSFNIDINFLAEHEFDQTTLLEILMSYIIEPQLGCDDTPCFVYDFPAAQAALARVSSVDNRVAERFEVYLNGMELANGFHELCDAQEQRLRFVQENKQRFSKGLPEIPLDENFLAALEDPGLPHCAGVALGLDRLLMFKMGKNFISDVISFPIEIA